MADSFTALLATLALSAAPEKELATLVAATCARARRRRAKHAPQRTLALGTLIARAAPLASRRARAHLRAAEVARGQQRGDGLDGRGQVLHLHRADLDQAREDGQGSVSPRQRRHLHPTRASQQPGVHGSLLQHYRPRLAGGCAKERAGGRRAFAPAAHSLR